MGAVSTTVTGRTCHAWTNVDFVQNVARLNKDLSTWELSARLCLDARVKRGRMLTLFRM